MIRTTRRRFLQTGAAGAAALAVPIRFARAAKKGGVMRMGKAHGQTVDSLDPATHENGFTIAMTHGYNNYLTEVAGDGSLVGQLAESWDASADAATWTFQLRKGVTYHNGREVTAEDVVASINHHRGGDSKSAAKPIVSPITDIKADGKHTVVFALTAGNADFPFIVSDYHLPILPSEGGNADWESGIGAGAYRIKSFEPGVRIDLERYADYWDSGRGNFDAIQMITIVDPAARTNAVITGEVDAIDRVDLKTVHLLKRRRGIKVHSIAGTQHYTFPMRTNVAPFDDNNVRMALKHAIDREEMVEKILQGFGVVGNDHPIGPGQRFFAKDLEQRTYDPDKAMHYLKQAGMDSLSVDSQRRGRGLCRCRRRRRAVRGERQGGRHRAEHRARAETTATGPTCGTTNRSAPATGAGGRPPTGCSRPLTRQACPGTTRCGSTSSSTRCCWRPVRSSTRRSAGRCTRRCSRSCATREAPSSRCSRPTCSPRPTRSPLPGRWPRTGIWTASAGWSAGRSPDPMSGHR